MRKKYLQLIILLAVLLLIVAAYVITSKLAQPDTDDADEDENEYVMLVDLNYTNVTSVSYTRNGETVKILTDSSAYGSYGLDGDSEFPLDKTKAIAMTQAVASIKCTRFVEDSRERFADYGLDEPEYVISATYDTNTAITINVGSYNSFTKTNYMNVDGTNKVYMISPAILDYFDYSKLELVSHDTKPAIGSDEITRIELSQNDGAQLVYTKTDDEWFVGNSGQPADETQIELITRALMGLTLTDCADYAINENQKLEKYGLLSPAVKATVTYKKEYAVTDGASSSSVSTKVDHTFTVLIGNADEENEIRYIKLPDSQLVYKISAELLSPLLQN